MITQIQLPTLAEIYELVSSEYFTQLELNFQMKQAKIAGFKSWEEYLKVLYTFFCTSLDFAEIKRHFESKVLNSEFQIPSRFEMKTFFHSIDEIELDKIREKVKGFSIEDQNRCEAFEEKLINNLCVLIVEKNAKTNEQISIMIKVFQDLLKHFQSSGHKSQFTLQNIVNYLDAKSMSQTKKYIKGILAPNFYLDSKKHLLQEIHELLVEADYIEPNVFFVNSFVKEYLPPEIKGTLWKKDATKLFYLLYCLNDRSEIFPNTSIPKIVDKLFRFTPTRNSKSLSDTFRKLFTKFDNEQYRLSQMGVIDDIISRVLEK